MYFWNTDEPSWFDVSPLASNPTSSSFSQNSSISTIIQEIMIKQWNPSYSYEKFYHSCSPSYCFYSKKVHTTDIIGLLIAMISMIGGLTLSLRLIASYSVIFINILISRIQRKERKSRLENEGNRRSVVNFTY